MKIFYIKSKFNTYR